MKYNAFIFYFITVSMVSCASDKPTSEEDIGNQPVEELIFRPTFSEPTGEWFTEQAPSVFNMRVYNILNTALLSLNATVANVYTRLMASSVGSLSLDDAHNMFITRIAPFITIKETKTGIASIDRTLSYVADTIDLLKRNAPGTPEWQMAKRDSINAFDDLKWALKGLNNGFDESSLYYEYMAKLESLIDTVAGQLQNAVETYEMYYAQ